MDGLSNLLFIVGLLCLFVIVLRIIFMLVRRGWRKQQCHHLQFLLIKVPNAGTSKQ